MELILTISIDCIGLFKVIILSGQSSLFVLTRLLKVVFELFFLLCHLEPTHFLRNLIQSLLQHNSLRNDQYHMTSDKHLPRNGCVNPLPPAICAPQKVTLMNENATPPC